ncbi:hypothetical protein VFPPC_14956 [Pochonia chlamydosporia 170]|uniref:Uncharacterized protein n=1 Tax=Pochonia chlamydosporia 170 TaxID=1380566 RepID=A0A179EXU2_METCM|nr:hypothetical protein VFPPC_14956 [Pochonia chlamydosporia 170]OAQ58001.1 hypothetical protein VFPPC_14956 [Pochonia chlamydosporia 170]
MAGSWKPTPANAVPRSYIDGEQQFHESFTIERHQISTTKGIKRKRYDDRQSEMIPRPANITRSCQCGTTDISDFRGSGQSDLGSETYHLFDPTKVAGYVSAVSLPSWHNVGPSFVSDLPFSPLATSTRTPASVNIPSDQLPSFHFSDGILGTYPKEAAVYPAFQKDLNEKLVDYDSFNNNHEAVAAQKRVDHIMGTLQQLGSRQRRYAKSQLKFIKTSSL